jgi:nicotinamidase-related amidase
MHPVEAIPDNSRQRQPHSAVGKHLIKWTGAFRSRIGDKVMTNLLNRIKSNLVPCVSNRTLFLNRGFIALLVAGVLLSSAAVAQLPDPGMIVDAGNTALVITDPQNDFLSPDGVTWGVVGESVTKNNTVENLENLLKAAKKNDLEVFISPHYYYPTDHGWKFEGALEALMHKIGMFDRSGALDMTDFEGSGADWLAVYKQYINDGQTVVTNPHKVYGPQANDLVLQLRKRGIDRVILAGMSGNLCVESHLRELLEQGFEVAVVTDATASAILPGLDGDAAAQTNFRFISNATWTTDQAVEKMSGK